MYDSLDNKYLDFIEECNILEEETILNEVYIGKTENLLELERAIGNLRKDYSFKKNYVATPEIKRIENAVIKQFNMEYFTLNIIPQNIPNAFTYTVAKRFDIIAQDKLTKMVIADQKNGYRYRDGNGLVIVTAIYGGILANPTFTDAEIVAILLHEIGHNFSQVVSKDIKLANQQLLYYWLLIVILRAIRSKGWSLPKDLYFTLTNSNIYHTLEKKAERKHGRLYAWMDKSAGSVKDFSFNLQLFCIKVLRGVTLSIFTSSPGKLIEGKKKTFDYRNNIKKNAGRQDEIIADKFAAIYGYGPEQFSALSKLTRVGYPADDVIRELPYGEMILLYNKANSLDFFKKDEHPHNIQRLNEMEQVLQYELNKKNLDPEMRKIIKSQLKEMEWLREEYLKIVKSDDDLMIIQKTYDAVVNDKMPEATTKELEKEINKQMDELCNKKY